CPRLPRETSHPAGVSGIEPRLALVHTFGVGTGRIDLRRWVEVCCTRPAELFGLARKGRLRPGCDADIILFDPKRQVTLSPETLHSPLPFTSYDGVALTGYPGPTLLLGSHLDSVPNGGRYDGALGVVAALHVLLAVHASNVRLPVRLEAIDFTDEEGTLVGLLGSEALAGKLTLESLQSPRGGR